MEQQFTQNFDLIALIFIGFIAAVYFVARFQRVLVKLAFYGLMALITLFAAMHVDFSGIRARFSGIDAKAWVGRIRPAMDPLKRKLSERWRGPSGDRRAGSRRNNGRSNTVLEF